MVFGRNNFPLHFTKIFIQNISTSDVFYNYSKDLSFNLMDLAKIQKWVSNRKQHQSTQDVFNTIMENRTIGHVTPLFVMYHKVPFANRNLEQFEMEFQQHHITPQEANIYKPKFLQPSKYSGLFYVPKLGKLNDFDESNSCQKMDIS